MTKIIVGLGNPGKEYNDTRHNIGFRIVDYINKEYGGDFSASGGPAAGWNLDQKLNAEISRIKINNKKVILVKPQIFVNNSGKVADKILKNLKIKVKDLTVVHDDLDIPFGKVKVSFGRSSAGHKGVESVIRVLKSDKFHRVRIGTFNSQVLKIKKIKDKRKKVTRINDFVVGPFGQNEKPKLNKLIKDAIQKILSIL